MKMFRILFTSDLHGSDLVFRKVVDAAIVNNVHALIIGGDISGKTMSPIVRKAGGKYEAFFLGKTRTVKSDDELNKLETDIRNAGSYPLVLTADQYQEIQRNKAKKDQVFLEKMKTRLKQWLLFAEEKLHPKDIRFLVSCGNDDHWQLDEVIRESSYAENPEDGVVMICENHEVISESAANKTPFNCPRDLDETQLEARIKTKIQQIKDVGRSIFVLHCPPYNSTIDYAPELDNELKPVIRGGHPLMIPVGSHAVRNIIQEYQPLASFHGHIHESFGFTKIGRTICMNPGSEYSNGIMRSFLVSLDRDSVRGQMLVTR